MNKRSYNLKLYIGIALIAFCFVWISGYQVLAASAKPSVTVSKKTLYTDGKPYTIQMKNTKSTAKISYKTNNKKVVSVNKEGVVKPLKAGKAKITVLVNQNGKQYQSTIDITVKKLELKYFISGYDHTQEYYFNTAYSLDFFAEDVKNPKYSFSVSNDLIHVYDHYLEYGVYNVLFTTQGIGDVTISMEEKTTGLTAAVTITIREPEPEIHYNGKIVYYGSYPQHEVTNDELTDEILEAEYVNQIATVNGVRYLRVTYKDGIYRRWNSYPWMDWEIETLLQPFHYFRFDPIAFRVLEDKNGELLLLSDKILFADNFKGERNGATWEDSSIRKELNEEFLNLAFTKKEQKAIKTVSNKNKDTKSVFYYDADKNKVQIYSKYEPRGKGGNTTKDKIFLLSLDEAMNGKYWPNVSPEKDWMQNGKVNVDREANPTTYALFRGSIADVKYNVSPWMLRSPGESNYYVSVVTMAGSVDTNGIDITIELSYGIRPAFRINSKDIK